MSILSGFMSNTLSLKCSSFPLQYPCCSYIIPYKISQLSANSKSTPAATATATAIFNLKNKPICRRFLISPPPSAAAETLSADTTIEASDDSASSKPTDLPQDNTQEVKEVVVVKALGKQPIQKPRLVLKFIWMEKNIGLGLDQLIPGHGTVPLSPYFFWPRKDAWEELKAVLESKPSISQKKMIILLNQATDIINLWQQSGGNLS